MRCQLEMSFGAVAKDNTVDMISLYIVTGILVLSVLCIYYVCMDVCIYINMYVRLSV